MKRITTVILLFMLALTACISQEVHNITLAPTISVDGEKIIRTESISIVIDPTEARALNRNSPYPSEVFRATYNSNGTIRNANFTVVTFTVGPHSAEQNTIDLLYEYNGSELIEIRAYNNTEEVAGTSFFSLDDQRTMTAQTVDWGVWHIPYLIDFKGNIHFTLLKPYELQGNSLGGLITQSLSGWSNTIFQASGNPDNRPDLFDLEVIQNGNTIETKLKNLISGVDTAITVSYENNEVHEITVYQDGKMLGNDTYRYTEFDEYGNWITCFVKDDSAIGLGFETEYNRTITYY